jgi:hypothetical protein
MTNDWILNKIESLMKGKNIILVEIIIQEEEVSRIDNLIKTINSKKVQISSEIKMNKDFNLIERIGIVIIKIAMISMIIEISNVIKKDSRINKISNQILIINSTNPDLKINLIITRGIKIKKEIIKIIILMKETMIQKCSIISKKEETNIITLGIIILISRTNKIIINLITPNPNDIKI